VRDSLINVGPLKDFSYGLRANADPNATGNAKQSNYELVSCMGLHLSFVIIRSILFELYKLLLLHMHVAYLLFRESLLHYN
jgi:hypothetical protein